MAPSTPSAAAIQANSRSRMTMATAAQTTVTIRRIHATGLVKNNLLSGDSPVVFAARSARVWNLPSPSGSYHLSRVCDTITVRPPTASGRTPERTR